MMMMIIQMKAERKKIKSTIQKLEEIQSQDLNIKEIVRDCKINFVK